MRQILDCYIQFEKAGYLDADGNKITELETKVQLTERLRTAEAGRLTDKLNYEKELQKIKDQHAKEQAQNRSLRHQPRVDWGETASPYIENIDLGEQ